MKIWLIKNCGINKVVLKGKLRALKYIYWKRRKAKNQTKYLAQELEKRTANKTQSRWGKKEQKLMK